MKVIHGEQSCTRLPRAVEDVLVPFGARSTMHLKALAPFAALDKHGFLLVGEVEQSLGCVLRGARVVVSAVVCPTAWRLGCGGGSSSRLCSRGGGCSSGLCSRGGGCSSSRLCSRGGGSCRFLSSSGGSNRFLRSGSGSCWFFSGCCGGSGRVVGC